VRRDADLTGRDLGPTRVGPTPPTPAGKTYEVKPGDCYYTIAKVEYGKASLWPIIEKANEGKDLFPGMKIVLPPKPAERTGGPAPAPGEFLGPPAPLGADEYEVKANDSLWKIAVQHLGNGAKYILIYEANKDKLKSPDQTLRLGMRLRLPPRDAVLPARTASHEPRPTEVRTAGRAGGRSTGRTGRRPDID